MTKEEVYKQFPDQDSTFLRFTLDRLLEMELLNPIKITLTPEYPGKVHPNYGKSRPPSRFTTLPSILGM